MFKKAANKITDLNIIIHCCACGKPIKTFWDKDDDLNGNWVGVESEYSEIFERFQTSINAAKCFECLSEKEWLSVRPYV